MPSPLGGRHDQIPTYRNRSPRRCRSFRPLLPRGQGLGADLLSVSGQTAWTEHGTLVTEADVAAQTGQVLRNLVKVLEGAGAGFQNVVEFTIYLVGDESVPPPLETCTEVFADLYPNREYPCPSGEHPVAGRRQGAGRDIGHSSYPVGRPRTSRGASGIAQ